MHFTDEDWRLKDRLLNTPISKRLLNPCAIPSKLLHSKSTKTVSQIERNQRAEKRLSKQIVNAALEEYDMRLIDYKCEILFNLLIIFYTF